VLADSRKYYQQTAVRRRLYAREYYHALSPAQKKLANRKAALQRKYGITPADYERMFAEQTGLCFLCAKPPRSGRPLSVDHAHGAKRVRKLLCEECNRALGFIERDPTWAARALAYLST